MSISKEQYEANIVRIHAEIVAFQSQLRTRNIIRSCLTCCNFEVKKANPMLEQAYCNLYKMQPPPYVIVDGCKDHDYIPF